MGPKMSIWVMSKQTIDLVVLLEKGNHFCLAIKQVSQTNDDLVVKCKRKSLLM